jgi:hypothetical protein
MKRLLMFAFLALSVLAVSMGTSPAEEKKENPKVALAPFNEYIGTWQGDGKVKKDIWSETIEWGWKFKGDDCWLIFKIKDGKFLKSGELKYMPDKKIYQLTAVDAKDQKLVYEGKVEKDYLTLYRTDEKTKEQQRVQMFNAGDGVFFNYRVSKAREGAKLFIPEYEVKEPECVVSGGLGTMAVTFKGKTYYVCCGGCRDAFNENPEKWIKEFEAKKKK